MSDSRTEVWKRRREITSLIVRGFAPGEIAEALGISCDTVYNDNRVIKSGDNEHLNAHCRNELNAQLYLNVKERIRELWRMFENATTEYIALRIMQELRLNDERILKRLPPLKTLAQMDDKKEVDAKFSKLIGGYINSGLADSLEKRKNLDIRNSKDNSKAPPFTGGVDNSDDKMKQIRDTMDLLDKLVAESEADEKAEDENPPEPDDKNSQ